MLKKLILSLAMLIAPLVVIPATSLPSVAVAASCIDTDPITGEIRYDAGSSTCRRAIVNSDGTLSVAVIPSTSTSQGITPVTSVGAASVVGKASAGTAWAFNGVSPASAGYWQLFNLASAPADATTNTPLWCYGPTAAASTPIDKVFNVPVVGSVGLTWVFSSSACGASLVKVAAVYMQSMAK
jgi:hypothetical protein